MDTGNKHCWECRRRRLVCDSLTPVCNRCSTAGIVCPGYSDKKPLVWVTPGKVLSRTWKRKPKSKDLPDSAPVKNAKQVIKPPTQELRTELHDIAEALEYYNTCILPKAAASQLGTNHFLTRFSSADVFPKSTIHTLMSMVISHRVWQVASTESPVWTVTAVPSESPRLYHYRQLAIQDLRNLVREEKTADSDELIGAVYTFMLAVLGQSITPAWRPHFDVFLELITRRGGFLQVIQSSPQLGLQLFAFWLLGVLADTTTPPDQHFPVLCSDTGTITLALSLFDKILYPYIPCPTEIFAHIVTINQLRVHCKRASTPGHVVHPLEDDTPLISGNNDGLSPAVTPFELLHQIEAFSAIDWATSKNSEHTDAWVLVGRIYQSAVALFCLLSLEQDLNCDESTDDGNFSLLRDMHSAQLMSLLKRGLIHCKVRKSIMWPIIVAGAGAVYEGAETQLWIRQTLCTLSKDLGSPLPLVAKNVLERFWVSGRTGWDECFDVPCCFVV